MFEDIIENPNYKAKKLLQEQLEFWKLKSLENSDFEQKYLDLAKKSSNYMQMVIKEYENTHGNLIVNDEMLKIVRNMLSSDGIEITFEELKRKINE